MKRKSCLLCVLLSIFFLSFAGYAAEPVSVVNETSDSITIAVTAGPLVLTPSGNGDNSLRCSVQGFSAFAEPGMPSVVLQSIMAAVPPGSSVEISTVVHSSQEFKNIDLAPVPGYSTHEEQLPQSVRDLNVYERDEYYPAQTAEISDTGKLRGMGFAQILIAPVQYNPVRRTLRIATSMTITLSFPEANEHQSESLIPLLGLSDASEHVFDAIRAATVINPGSSFAGMNSVQDYPLASMQRAADVQDSPFAIKIITSESGIYRVRYTDIAGLGADLSGLTNSNLKIDNNGQEIAVYRSGTGQFNSGDYILFYAQDFQSEYSSTNTYWLYQGTDNGLTMQTVDSDPDSGFPQEDSFLTSLLLEEDLTWKRNLTDYVDGEDQWFWKLLNIFGTTTQNITFTLNDFATDDGTFEVEVYLRGRTAFNHLTQVSINGTFIGEIDWQGAVAERRTLTGISPLLFNEGINTLTIEAVAAPGNDPGSTPDLYYVNWADLTYVRRYVAADNRLSYGSDTSGDMSIEVNGFTESDIRVFDVTQPTAPIVLTGTSIEMSGGTSRVLYEYNVDSTTAFCAVTPNSTLTPDEFIVDTPSNLMSPRADIDYIIITHAMFASTVEQLKTIREQSGLRVEIVDVQDIYDEFSYGIKDVPAIRDFLRYAYNNWHATDHPTYVALVGDATYDYRDNLGLYASGKADLVSTYLGYRGSLGSGVGAVASDNWLVCVDGDDALPDMIVGRLCVKQNQDLQNIIDKITAYENSLPDEWQSRILQAVDYDDNYLFESTAATLQEEIPDEYSEVNLYLSTYESDVPTATEDLIAAISDGALITTYIGHGSSDTWSKRRWFQTPNQNTGGTRDDVASLTNLDQYTFLLVLNCLSGTFSEAKDDYSMAEEFNRQSERGAVACIAPSASGLPSEHELLGDLIYQNFFQRNISIAGALLTLSKIEAYRQTLSQDIIETFIFFGDPALELKMREREPIAPFETLEPVDDAQLPLYPETLFTWNSGPYKLFKIQFSKSEFFEPKNSYFYAPKNKKLYIEQDYYTPSKKEWKKVQKYFKKNGVVYWRVVAYDPATLTAIDYTDYNSFTF